MFVCGVCRWFYRVVLFSLTQLVLFQGLADSLTDPSWDVRYKASMFVCEAIPKFGEGLDECKCVCVPVCACVGVCACACVNVGVGGVGGVRAWHGVCARACVFAWVRVLAV